MYWYWIQDLMTVSMNGSNIWVFNDITTQLHAQLVRNVSWALLSKLDEN